MKTETSEQQNVKQPYTKPTLEEMGDLKSQTLGLVVGAGVDGASNLP
ncbi:MAG: hypothetical protein RL514_2944 [Verrucomicrobiota bacterium]|jgi:hypothetical protein